MKNKCSVIQANLHNSRCATLETLAYIRQENIDIALCQEPYNYKTSRGTYTIPGLMNQRLIANNDNRFSSCLLVNNPTLNVLHLRHLSSKYVTVVSIDGISTESVFVISIYAPPNNDSVRNMVTKLQQILTNLQDKTVLLGGDFNCRSTIWFDTLCDRNSPVLEDFILANDLVIFNEDNLPSTFSSANGSSNIDLTLGTTDTINWVRDWTVLQDVNTSDHRVIRFTCALPLQSAASIEEYVMDCSNLKLEDIEPDLSDLCRGLLRDFPVLVSPRTIDAAVDRFYEGINRIVRAKAKKRRTYPERPE
jgi:exonuclease III